MGIEMSAVVGEGASEVELVTVSGRAALRICAAVLIVAIGLLAFAVRLQVRGGSGAWRVIPFIVAVMLVGLTVQLFRGLTAVQPGEGVVVLLFGRYVGTVRTAGLHWLNPWTKRRAISTRIHSHETTLIKVNDADGNPIEIAALVIWQVHDTARALYAIDDYLQFAARQCEAAVRELASAYRYDEHSDGRPSLCGHSEEITKRLSREIALRLAPAGIAVLESRIVRLAYAQEIAQAMLRRQQAAAIVAARQQIVEGAVGMVSRPWHTLMRRMWWSSTRSARRPWSAICSSYSAATTRPNRWSTQAPSITGPDPPGR